MDQVYVDGVLTDVGKEFQACAAATVTISARSPSVVHRDDGTTRVEVDPDPTTPALLS